MNRLPKSGARFILGISLAKEGAIRRLSRRRVKSQCSYAVAAEVRFCWKHSRHSTGRPCVGLKGTVVSLPQAEQLVRVSTLA